jgi:hypothetical protein
MISNHVQTGKQRYLYVWLRWPKPTLGSHDSIQAGRGGDGEMSPYWNEASIKGTEEDGRKRHI